VIGKQVNVVLLGATLGIKSVIFAHNNSRGGLLRSITLILTLIVVTASCVAS